MSTCMETEDGKRTPLLMVVLWLVAPRLVVTTVSAVIGLAAFAIVTLEGTLPLERLARARVRLLPLAFQQRFWQE